MTIEEKMERAIQANVAAARAGAPTSTGRSTTIVALRDNQPYVTELDEEGAWSLDEYKATVATKFEIQVDDPFSQVNSIRRTSGEGKRVHARVVRRYDLQPGEIVKIPRIHRRAIRTEQCSHGDCAQRPLGCTNPEHARLRLRMVVGGESPLLVRLDEAEPPRRHPTTMGEPAVVEAPQVPIAFVIRPKTNATAEQRALERARARRAAGGGQ